jgi:hypothetical protein
MNIPRFNRHANMDSATQSRILDLISDLEIIERCSPRNVINMLYGAFDGYDYSELIVQDELISQLTNGGNGHLANEIEEVAEIIKSYSTVTAE